MRRQAGFTLLEILVSLVVLAALLAGLAQAVHFGVKAWNSQIALVSRNADLDTVDRTLRTLMVGMMPPSAADRPTLQGSAHEVRFVTELPAGAPVRWTRLAAVGLLMEDHRLVLRWSEQPHARLLGTTPPTHNETLISGIDGLNLQYRAADGSWSDQWSQGVLPQLIRIHLTLKRRWPDILIAPMRDSVGAIGQ